MISRNSSPRTRESGHRLNGSSNDHPNARKPRASGAPGSSENQRLFGWPDDPMARWPDLLCVFVVKARVRYCHENENCFATTAAGLRVGPGRLPADLGPEPTKPYLPAPPRKKRKRHSTDCG